MTPSISVAIPVYNRRDLVDGAIASALMQDVPGLEVVVVDNCSTDGTWEYLQSIRDTRVSIVRNERNVGLFGNFSRAIEHAQGEFVLLLCSDDRLRPGFLAHAISKLKSEPRAVMISSAGRLIDKNGETVRYINQLVKSGLYEGASARPALFWFFGSYGVNLFNYPSGIVLRRGVIGRELPFREDLGDPGDIDMWLRCLKHGDLLITDYVGCDVIWHADQFSSANRRVGHYIPDLSHFAGLCMDEQREGAALRRFRRSLGASALAWGVQKAMRGEIEQALSATSLGPSWFDMLTATARRTFYRTLAKAGIVANGSLRPLPEMAPHPSLAQAE